MKCKYCKEDVSPLKFYFHLAHCKRVREVLINQKINRRLTVPNETLLNLVENNILQLNNALKLERSYWNVLNESKLDMEETIAVNDLFWFASTPYYNTMAPGWLYLGGIEKYKDKIYGICSDWRMGPPDSVLFTIDMIPAEIIAEAFTLIDITVDTKAFINNTPYQTYINEIFRISMEQE